jgi:hypothetical protein
MFCWPEGDQWRVKIVMTPVLRAGDVGGSSAEDCWHRDQVPDKVVWTAIMPLQGTVSKNLERRYNAVRQLAKCLANFIPKA